MFFPCPTLDLPRRCFGHKRSSAIAHLALKGLIIYFFNMCLIVKFDYPGLLSKNFVKGITKIARLDYDINKVESLMRFEGTLSDTWFLLSGGCSRYSTIDVFLQRFWEGLIISKNYQVEMRDRWHFGRCNFVFECSEVYSVRWILEGKVRGALSGLSDVLIFP